MDYLDHISKKERLKVMGQLDSSKRMIRLGLEPKKEQRIQDEKTKKLRIAAFSIIKHLK